MKLFVPCENTAIETRVAMSPEVVRKLTKLGFNVVVEKGAGHLSRIDDAAFVEAGGAIGNAGDGNNADVVFKVRRPTPQESSSYKKNALILASMDPHGNEGDIDAMAKAGICGFSMEFMPRITRAQVMDVLSSQANLAGYQSVIEASGEYDKALPMMMTAAGTVPAAKVFVMGAGVAGLQAIATARRLGAIVTATDVRPAAKEQVESLGAKFVAVEDEEFKQAETAGGYAKQMSKEYQARQAELVARHIAKQDIVITTALIPGRPAPKLVSKEMIANMSSGSVLVDLAVERGGNVEGAVANEITKIGDVSIVGYENMAGRIGATASLLYAKNLYAFLETMVDKETSTLKVDWDDELIVATLLTRDGAVVHPAFVQNTDKDAKPKKVKKTKKVSKIVPAAPKNVKSTAIYIAKSAGGRNSNQKAALNDDGTFDDLTRINGIGPANVRKLEALDVNSFAQIAAWSSKDEESFGDKLAFPGRIEREGWVKQAKEFMNNGDT